jgi:chromosome partitioning protein
MYDRRNRLSQEVEQELRAYFGDKVARAAIPRNVRLSEAPGFGEPAAIRYPASIGARAYEEFVDEVFLQTASAAIANDEVEEACATP